MRITRAAKVAAFPLIVLALVALVACQGGPGTKGDKGDKGDAGMDGPEGGVGAAALVVKSGDAPNILINDSKAADGTVMLGGAETYDVFGLFSGGSGDITYTAAQADVTGDPPTVDTDARALYEASIEEGTSILTVKFEGTTTTETVNHTDQFTIDVSATDEVGTKVTTQVMAQRNTDPVAMTDNDIPDFRIGTQDMDWPDSNSAWPDVPYTCEKLNACKLTFTAQHFMDQGDLMYTATSESPERAAVACQRRYHDRRCDAHREGRRRRERRGSGDHRHGDRQRHG